MPASMPRRRMNASTALLSPFDLFALLLMWALFIRNGVAKNFFVDQIEVSADAAQVANRGADRGFPQSIVLDENVGPDVDLAVRMGKFYRPPRRLESTR